MDQKGRGKNGQKRHTIWEMRLDSDSHFHVKCLILIFQQILAKIGPKMVKKGPKRAQNGLKSPEEVRYQWKQSECAIWSQSCESCRYISRNVISHPPDGRTDRMMTIPLRAVPRQGVKTISKVRKYVINKESHDLQVITEKSALVIKQNLKNDVIFRFPTLKLVIVEIFMSNA